METVNVMESNYDRALPYGKEEIDRNPRSKDERSTEVKMDGPHPVRHRIAITRNKVALADNARLQRFSTTTFASSLVKRFKASIIQFFGTSARGSSRMR